MCVHDINVEIKVRNVTYLHILLPYHPLCIPSYIYIFPFPPTINTLCLAALSTGLLASRWLGSLFQRWKGSLLDKLNEDGDLLL